jgi:hypothetical protein
VVAAGRRWGKTHFAACWLISNVLKNSGGGKSFKDFDVYYVAPTFSQAKDIMYRLIERLGEDYITKAWPSSLTFEFCNGRVLQLKGADRPDRLRGVGLSHLCADEYASMRAEVWTYVLRATLADLAPESKALFIGTPDRRNHFYGLFQAESNGAKGWRSFKFFTKDSPYILDSEVDDARATMPEAVFKREYEADFGDAATVVLNPDLIKVEEKSKAFRANSHVVVGVRLRSFDELGQDEWGQMVISMSSIVVVCISGDKYHVLDFVRTNSPARWLATKLFAIDKEYSPDSFVIGSQQYGAIEDHIEEREARFGRGLYFEEAKDPDSGYVDRSTWILEPLLDSGRITFEPGDYIQELSGSFGMFPSAKGTDDMIRALSLACSVNYGDESESDDEDSWHPLDKAVGY